METSCSSYLVALFKVSKHFPLYRRKEENREDQTTRQLSVLFVWCLTCNSPYFKALLELSYMKMKAENERTRPLPYIKIDLHMFVEL